MPARKQPATVAQERTEDAQGFPPEVFMRVILALPTLKCWRRLGGGLDLLPLDSAVRELVEADHSVGSIDAAFSAGLVGNQLTRLPSGSLDAPVTLQAAGTFPLWVDRLRQGARSRASTPTFNSETGTLFLNRRPLSLEANEQDVLKVLVSGGAMTLQSLRRKSGCDHPDRVLKGLRTKYPVLKKHVSLPGKKGRGGYFTTIQLAE